MPASGELVLYSTPEHLALEQRLVERIVASRRHRRRRRVRARRSRGRSRRADADGEQRRWSSAACLDGDGVAVVAGQAGTGKTFALAAAREAWQASGHPVLGVAVARRAASELRDGAGIESTSVAALLQDLRLTTAGCPTRTVLVVDEAGMVPTRDLAELLDRVEDARRQARARRRPPPAARARGGRHVPRARAARARDRAHATTSARSIAGSARRSTSFARAGRRRRSPSTTSTAGSPSSRTSRRRGERWSATGSAAGDGDAVMIAHRRADVAELNRLARDELRRAGAARGRRARAARRRVRGRRSGRGQAQRPPRSASTTATAAASLAVDPASGALLLRLRRAAGRARRRLPHGRDARRRADAAARVRDHGPRRARADGRPLLRARRRGHEPRVGVRRAQPRAREQPALPQRAPRRRTGGVRARAVPSRPIRRAPRGEPSRAAPAQVLAIDAGGRRARSPSNEDARAAERGCSPAERRASRHREGTARLHG